MITDQKILELNYELAKADYLGKTDKQKIGIIRNWLEENKIVDHQEWLRHEKDRHDAEEYECAMMLLDKLNVPKIDSVNNDTYSLVGRIKLYKEM